MALPRDTDPYEHYTDQLVYFSARLAANPETASLAASVDTLLSTIDSGYEALRQARRAEVRARAQRDHHDGLGDNQVKRYKRRFDALGDAELSQRLFPSGLAHTIAPRGRAQIERLTTLSQAIAELAASPRVAAHPEADELAELLEKGKSTVDDIISSQTPIIEDWEAERLEVARALDTFNFRRTEGVGQLGAVMGELRAKLGGDAKAAYAFTQPARSGGSAGNDESGDEESGNDVPDAEG